MHPLSGDGLKDGIPMERNDGLYQGVAPDDAAYLLPSASPLHQLPYPLKVKVWKPGRSHSAKASLPDAVEEGHESAGKNTRLPKKRTTAL